ncbi:hypothetical protein CEP54_008514 [Fusarium duplospermum]|uniref:C2H2-type domain-containing protein n=1 Tax=Fusarium duplospermum TaxID=1325734 RepID=A0A428PVA7_9HYPO|nr:hypothetical protein CEP54_008514 [Fusarium duplospermum]
MDSYYQHSPTYHQQPSSTTESTQPMDATYQYSYQYSSSSTMETPQWAGYDTYQPSPSPEEPLQSAEAYSYLDSSSSIAARPRTTAESSPYAENHHCLHPGCTAKPFRRAADLQRHYKHTHSPDSNKDAYYCDYPRCTRAQEPFRRRDHFRDHLREYHREDIQKRGEVVNDEGQEDRRSASGWWRCPRCLIRVSFSQSGSECPKCKGSCEPKRKEKHRGH